eukprot:SAG11_NODE_5427_length_1564_cov_1.032082_1_plen_321_part_10
MPAADHAARRPGKSARTLSFGEDRVRQYSETAAERETKQAAAAPSLKLADQIMAEREQERRGAKEASEAARRKAQAQEEEDDRREAEAVDREELQRVEQGLKQKASRAAQAQVQEARTRAAVANNEAAEVMTQMKHTEALGKAAAPTEAASLNAQAKPAKDSATVAAEADAAVVAQAKCESQFEEGNRQIDRSAQVLCGRLFDEIDEDASTYLEEPEGKLFLTCSGCDAEDVDYYWQDLLRTADKNGDGRISKDEFLDYVLGEEELDGSGHFLDKEHQWCLERQLRLMGIAGHLYAQLFDAVDQDGSGFLEEAEGKVFLRC